MKSSKGPVQVSWQRISLIVLCVVLALVLFLMLFATAYVHHLLGLVTGNGDSMNETMSPEDLATFSADNGDSDSTYSSVNPTDIVSPTIPVENLQAEGVINILLIGEDRRPGQSRQRSDSMILCSFNTNTNTLTMISFLRDTYISQIPGYWAEKLNAAYALGGAKTLNQTLAAYFGVHVDANIAVQFDGFIEIIDMLGGVDIDLTEKEANWLNKEWAYSSDLLVSPGMNHLNGEQALAYSRIRKLDMDAMRAERQRKVLTALINAYKNKSVGEMLTLATDILGTGFIETDMSTDEVINYVKILFPMLATTTINNQQIPAAGTYTELTVGKITATKVCDLEANRKILKQILGN